MAKRKARKTKPVVFVFCEGLTEEKYVDMLRTSFRVPIQIVTRVLHTKISSRLVEAHIRQSGYPEVDKTFLFYDGDRDDVVERLYRIPNTQIMLSYPCVELWFLLHYADHSAHVDSQDIIRFLHKHEPGYKKGEINEAMRKRLLSEWQLAARRAKKLPEKKNPSTSAYILPEYLMSL